MKYLLLIFLFACSQPTRQQGKNIFSVDSAGVIVGPLTIQPTHDSGAFTGIGYYPLVIKHDSGTLRLSDKGEIAITGDTMKVIKVILKQLLYKSDEETRLGKENQELRRLIEGLIKQQNEIQHTAVDL